MRRDLTKSCVSLIMNLGGTERWCAGKHTAPDTSLHTHKEGWMRIHIAKLDRGFRTMMVVPNRSAHMSPIIVRGTDKAAVRAELQEVVDAVSLAERHGNSERGSV